MAGKGGSGGGSNFLGDLAGAAEKLAPLALAFL
jgi:hypothetical protein